MTVRASGPAPQYPIASVERAIQVLLLFRERRSIRLGDVAAHLGVATSTAHRLLAMLLMYRLVVKHDGTYTAGPALVELGLAVTGSRSIGDLAEPALRQVAERLGETASLGVLAGSEVEFVRSIECAKPLRIVNRDGTRIPAFHSALGKVLLASTLTSLPDLYPDPVLIDPDYNVETSRAQLERELVEVRELGYAVNTVPATLDFVSVAVPVRGTPAAIAVAAPTQRAGSGWQQHALGVLRAAAAELEQLLPGAIAT